MVLADQIQRRLKILFSLVWKADDPVGRGPNAGGGQRSEHGADRFRLRHLRHQLEHARRSALDAEAHSVQARRGPAPGSCAIRGDLVGAQVAVVPDVGVATQQRFREPHDVGIHQRVAHEERPVAVAIGEIDRLIGEQIGRLLAVIAPLNGLGAEAALERTASRAFERQVVIGAEIEVVEDRRGAALHVEHGPVDVGDRHEPLAHLAAEQLQQQQLAFTENDVIDERVLPQQHLEVVRAGCEVVREDAAAHDANHVGAAHLDSLQHEQRRRQRRRVGAGAERAHRRHVERVDDLREPREESIDDGEERRHGGRVTSEPVLRRDRLEHRADRRRRGAVHERE